MNADRWREIRELFDELADASAGTRAARLAGVDAEVRREVNALLAADPDAEAQLARMFHSGPAMRDPLGLTGRTLSHFVVGEPLGAGGMGVVYAATDTQLGRAVALKVPLPERHLDPSGRQRFLFEARSAGALDHPNLCSIHEVGESEDGLLFLAMPLYRGETLRARLERSGALPASRAVEIARQVARGLAAAHAAGIVHRDLKPANVMLLPDGLVKVLDFGLAKAREGSISTTGSMLGTAAYMAPEQIRSDPVDDRTDLWALGAVLYEMVTGRKPFRGEHEASLAHAIVHDDPAPPSSTGHDVPPGLERIILTLLAKEPARRPASAAEVEHLLTGFVAGTSPARRRAPLRRGVVLGAAAVVLAAAVIAFGARRTALPAPRADADLVAIARFDAADPGLEFWREGLVDILARDLDGAGPLRTVPPSVVLRRWEGRSDRPSAEALGERTRAGIVVFGNVVRRGADSIEIRATVLDRARSTVDPDLAVTGTEDRIGELADSLGMRILRLLGQRRAIASARHISIGARSLPALKAFLQGEQFYRRGEIDSALAHYDRAITEDSTFALALRRMAWALGSGARTSARYAPSGDYIRRAVIHNRGLSPRDSLLLWSDSVGQLPHDAPTADVLIGNLFRAVSSLEELARRYPEDPAIWYELGERYAHTPMPAGDEARALAAFDRAIALDSGFAPAYMHTIRHAFQAGGAGLARRYAAAYVRQGLPSAYTPDIHFALQILDSGVAAPGVQQVVRTGHASRLTWAAHEHFRWAVDSEETAIALYREVAHGEHDFEGAGRLWVDPLMRRQHLALALAFRGHLREAVEAGTVLLNDPAASRWSHTSDPFPDLAFFGRLDPALVRRTLERAFEVDWTTDGSPIVAPRYLTGLPWLMLVQDEAMLQRFVVRGSEMARASVGALGKARGRYFGGAAEAYLALVRADTAEAIRRFEALSDSLCVVAGCFPEKLTLARLLAARGDDRSAAAIHARWEKGGNARPVHVIAALEHARIAERLGDHVTAARQYRFVVEAWRGADPELAGVVDEARGGLRRVEGGEAEQQPGR
jgi:serine/threonine-protein kinase